MRPTRFPARLLTSYVVASLFAFGTGGRATAGGHFGHLGGYSQTTRVTSYGAVPGGVVVPVTSFPVYQSVAPLQSVPVIQFAPSPTYQPVPQPLQVYQMAPMLQASPLGATGAVLSLQGGAGASNLTAGGRNGGLITLSTSPNDPVGQNDALFLAAVSSNHAFFQSIEKLVQDELQNLVNGRGQGLNNGELEAVLLGLVKAALPPQVAAFAPEISRAIELVIQRIIHRAVANRRAAPVGPVAPVVTPNSVPPLPLNPSGGAQAFEVTGRIVLTPVSGNDTAPPAKPDASSPELPPVDPARNPANDARPAPHPVR